MFDNAGCISGSNSGKCCSGTCETSVTQCSDLVKCNQGSMIGYPKSVYDGCGSTSKTVSGKTCWTDGGGTCTGCQRCDLSTKTCVNASSGSKCNPISGVPCVFPCCGTCSGSTCTPSSDPSCSP